MPNINDDKSICELARTQLKGIDLTSVKLDNIAADDLKEFLSNVHILNGNKTLKRLIDDLILKQVEFTVKEAENIEQVNFGRATINGLSLLKEYLEKYDALYVEENKPDEDFDKKEVI